MPRTIGYARTSTDDQKAGLESQIRDLRSSGCNKVFSEQVSSVAQRDGLAEALAFMEPGDTLMVTKPDRLARSTMDLLTIEEDLTKRGIGLVVLSMGGQRLDTRNPTSKLMLTILAAVAAWEREIMLERQLEGIAKAKADGKYQGRRRADPATTDSIRNLRDSGKNLQEIADELGVSLAAVRWALKSVKPTGSTQYRRVPGDSFAYLNGAAA